MPRLGRLTARQKNAIQMGNPRYLRDLQAGMVEISHTPVMLEIGFGMGQSFLETARTSPDTQFIGVDLHPPGVGAVLAAIQEENLQNIIIFQADAVDVVPQCIPDHSLDGINIFFPDPWPKKRHHKRRLIQPDFVAILCHKLKPGGRLHLATDWEDYAHHMLAVLSAAPHSALSHSRLDRPMTKYEKRGLALGHPVWDLVFYP